MRSLFALSLTLTASIVSGAGHASRDVLVFGGTGRLGAPIVRLLVEAGYPVTVFARASSDRGRLDGLEVDYLVGDLSNADSVSAAIGDRQFDIVIDATARDRASGSFYDTAMRNMLAALGDAGVRRFILHGSVGAGDNMNEFPDIDFSRMMDVMVAKGEAERLLIESGIPYTIIRNGQVKRDGTPATGNAYLTEDQSVLGIATREDLALLTMACVASPACLGKIYHAVDDSWR